MNKAIFLDRDGVVNIEKNYVYKIRDFEFIDGIFDLCKKYQDEGYFIIIITNQAGIARGYYTEGDFRVLTRWMINEFKQHDVKISKVYHCPHYPDITGPCYCRKPNPGMILQAKEEFNLNLKECVLVGDKESDIQAGRNAGISILIKLD
jgi:D-glycero-D-manno-heptose 1,7-bisphosphate phosphatase